MTLAEQVDEVIVKGWDADKQEPIVGRADQGNLYPDIQEPRMAPPGPPALAAANW
jgi:hypothetical protein